MATPTQLLKLALFSGGVSATGNTIAQYLVSRTPESTQSASKNSSLIPGYEPVQALRFFAYGAAFTPFSYRWHAFLNWRFPIGSTIKTAASKKLGESDVVQSAAQRVGMVLKRVAIDQAVFAPLATGAFVFGMGALEGLGPSELLERGRTQYMDILLVSYALWPAAQLINFSAIPLAYRVPFGSTVSLFWNTYLGWSSWKAKQSQKPHTPAARAIAGPEVASAN
ncbi:hypothetical protein LPJ66_008320 [Kickxella alabastrina]|uniref:Uncharacterized protein n=1 Tax=Kickxella alabastrina TaxID=61397 RepID=A0ACC1IA75_9FUNG|nr:hypothetical protein LPJ66_008320 [Kickxella alabastrina]